MSNNYSEPSEDPRSTNSLEQFKSYLQAALYWFKFGLKVIPITPAPKEQLLNGAPGSMIYHLKR